MPTNKEKSMSGRGGIEIGRRALGRVVAALATVAALAVFAAPASADFGIYGWDVATTADPAGSAYAQAGGHPYEIVTHPEINRHTVESEVFFPHPVPYPDGTAKDLLADLPPGFVGAPAGIPQCKIDELSQPLGTLAKCPMDSQVGIAYVEEQAVIYPVSVYNMEPPVGFAARFGFNLLGASVVLDASAVGQGEDLHVLAGSRNIAQALALIGTKLVFWGTPADHRHDGDRCRLGPGSYEEQVSYPFYPFSPAIASPNLCEMGVPVGGSSLSTTQRAFLTMPTACTAPGEGLRYDLRGDSWEDPGVFDTASVFSHEPAPDEAIQRGTESCDVVPATPEITLSPTAHSASSPSGLDTELRVPTDGLLNPEGIAQSALKKVEVTLPEGVSINPSQGEGLGVCTPEEVARESAAAAGLGCPSTSKIGTTEVATPLLDHPLRGAVYIAKPYDNPFGSLLALYVAITDPDTGTQITLPGKVIGDPKTGQLTTTFDHLPQVPVSSFKLHFREGARSPLSTPSTCGTYTTTVRFTPHSAPNTTITRTPSFQITSGVNGGPCPSGATPPFRPGLQAGTLNNAAGHYSPFNVRLTREDGEQEITNFSIKLPPGVIGKIAGLGYCSDAAIEAARHRTGTEELANPSCPASSQVGRTLAGAGVGSSLVYAPGKIYYAGPYHGAPISIAAITAAKVGPFDLGTVVVRFALKVDPETAEIFIDSTGSDPIPHIIAGISLHVRDIRAYNDRPEFVLNPTSCERTSTASTVLGSGLDFASAIDDRPVTVSTPFQAADCAALGFRPDLRIALKGGTKRAGHPKLRATLKMKPGMANIARAEVTLPKSEFLDQSHIGTVCTRVQFNQGTHPGEKCPAASVYGYAKGTTPLLDTPIEGPVFLRSSEHKLPDLVAALHSRQIDINVVGRIDSLNGRIRSTFESVPDAPVSTFTLTMAGAKKGLLENSTNLCAKTNRAIARFDGHNGKISDSNPAVKADCSKAKKRAAKRRNAR